MEARRCETALPRAGSCYPTSIDVDLTATSGAGASIEEAQPLDSLAGGAFVGRQREMGVRFTLPETATAKASTEPEKYSITRLNLNLLQV